MWCGQADRPAFFRSGRRRESWSISLPARASSRFRLERRLSAPSRQECRGGHLRRGSRRPSGLLWQPMQRSSMCKFTATVRVNRIPAMQAQAWPSTGTGVVTQLWYGLYNPTGTNNTAELTALHQALVFAEQEIATGSCVQILSDSSYAISCIAKWATGWEKRGWKRSGGDIKNLDLIKTAYALYSSIQPQPTLTHVSCARRNGRQRARGPDGDECSAEQGGGISSVRRTHRGANHSADASGLTRSVGIVRGQWL